MDTISVYNKDARSVVPDDMELMAECLFDDFVEMWGSPGLLILNMG